MSRFPTGRPVRLPLNHPNDTMFLSDRKLREPSRVERATAGETALDIGLIVTGDRRRRLVDEPALEVFECSVSCFESKRSPVSEHAPPDCQPPTEIFTGAQGSGRLP